MIGMWFNENERTNTKRHMWKRDCTLKLSENCEDLQNPTKLE